MNNPPSKEELIISIINFLENDIISELKGQTRFHAHVAKNSLNIVLRQLRLEKENNSKEKKRFQSRQNLSWFSTNIYLFYICQMGK